ncbi:transmembrane prolyl 4-hydroxylase-like [Antedon mediterranea]|uniref:transmembrane prolyl 4-hydroxylase-like n=1 Tax=Antedon mediterranea TaxID=105859 RepID=UPI003AF730A6
MKKRLFFTLIISLCILSIFAIDAPDPLPDRLFRLDPVKIGFERVLELERGKMFTVQTVSTKPPVFEINNFLSDSECDHIMQLALEEGLGNSTVLEDPRTRFMGSHQDVDVEKPSMKLQDTIDENILAMFKEFDWSQDGRLDTREVLDILPPDGNAFMSVNEVQEMFLDLGLDKNADGYLDFEEYKVTSEAKIRDWMQMKMNSDKTRVVRESKQVWLSQNDANDPVLRSLRERVIALIQLPRILIEGSEMLQVVKYNVGGHYHAHYDSEEIDPDMHCHHSVIEEEDVDDVTQTTDKAFYQEHRLCRYVTILYYLNDVDEGGQTAFPLAGNETINNDELTENGDVIYDLSHHCYDAKLRVEPVKGKAVMWYNHYLDETGWLGEMDEFSLHGGCDVNSGTKWIANNWINIDNNREKQEQYHTYLLNEFHRKSNLGDDKDIKKDHSTEQKDGIKFPEETNANSLKEPTNAYVQNDEL